MGTEERVIFYCSAQIQAEELDRKCTCRDNPEFHTKGNNNVALFLFTFQFCFLNFINQKNKIMNILLEQGWSEIDSKLIKNFLLEDFNEAIRFINRVADDANKLSHHPDIKLYKYKNVRISLTTHSLRRITDKDIKLAKTIDKSFKNLQLV